MKRSKGFVLISELLCFCLCALLLASIMRSLTACFGVQQHTLRLTSALSAAMRQAVGAEPADMGRFRLEQQSYEQNGRRMLEVTVYDTDTNKRICTLLQAE